MSELAKDSKDPIVQEALQKIASGKLVPSSGPIDVVWTEEDKQRLNAVLAEAFGWKGYMEATQELIDKVGKRIFFFDLLQDDFFKNKYYSYKTDDTLPELIKILSTAIDSVWNGTDDNDKVEKEKYQTLAKFALQAAGFKVTFTDEMHKDLLV